MSEQQPASSWQEELSKLSESELKQYAAFSAFIQGLHDVRHLQITFNDILTAFGVYTGEYDEEELSENAMTVLAQMREMGKPQDLQNVFFVFVQMSAALAQEQFLKRMN